MNTNMEKEIKDALITIRDKWEVWKYPNGGFEIFEKESRAIVLITHPTESNGQFDGSIIAKFPEWLRYQQATIDELRQKVKLLKQANDPTAKMFSLVCEHTAVARKSNSAQCTDCGKFIGWWCEESPTHYCQYNHDECDECCIHCGEPEERK